MRAASEPRELADLLRHLLEPAPHRAAADHARQRRATSSSSGCSRARCSAPGNRRRSSSTASCTSRSGRTTSSRSTRRRGACSGSTATTTPPTSASAAARTTAASRSTATPCSWARSTRTVAIDARNGQPLWKTKVADSKLAYSVTMAPLVIKDLVHRRHGRRRVRHPRLHRRVRREDRPRGLALQHDPGPGEPGSETWSGDDWEHGGASVWITGSYDPELNLTYWGIGNPGPDWNPDQRPGDNLYSDSVVALDADTGELKWHFQFTPNDAYDYDAVQIPVLVDMPWQRRAAQADALGEPQRLLLRARPRDRRVPAGHAVREGQLGERARRERPADPDAAAARRADVARQPGRHELVLAVVQPAHGALLSLGVGRLRVVLPPRAARVRARPQLRGRRAPRRDARARLARRRDRPAHADQQLDGRGRARRGHRARPADGRSSGGASGSTT